MSIPDSGNYAALGFAEASKIPYGVGIIRNHYIGRTFIQPSQYLRDFSVKVKLNPIKDVLKGKRIVIVEDSIVRGTTSRSRVKTLREAGAKEIHMRISCPPIKFPCYYGIDFPTRRELIAANHSVNQIRDFIGVDSLGYLSHEGMLNAMLLPKDSFCTACFTGNYPVKPPAKVSKYSLEK
jgi:amidophosphoribosyltransferase